MSEMSTAQANKLAGVASNAAAVSSSTPANIGTAAAGSATDASKSDHVHDLPDLVTGATKGGSGKLVASVTYDAKGRNSSAATEASPGVDFSKGPWKAFGKVTLGSAAQALSIPVADGENNGILRATGLLLSDGTARNVTIKINGSSTNVTMEFLQAIGTTVASATGAVGSTDIYGAFFELVLLTAKTGSGFRRVGKVTLHTVNATIANQVYVATFQFKDTATTITSVDLDCGNATGLAAGSYVVYEEGIVG